MDRGLLSEESRCPQRKAGWNRCDHLGARVTDIRLLDCRCKSDHWGHHDGLWGVYLTKRDTYVGKHHRARNGDCSAQRPRPAILQEGSVSQLCFAKFHLEPPGEIGRGLDSREIAEQHQGASNRCILPGALFTFSYMHLHADELYARQSVIYELKVFFPEFPTVHVSSFEGSDTVPE